MIVMLDTSASLEDAEKELQVPVEELFTPLTGRNPKDSDRRFAMDNGAFSHFDKNSFDKMLSKHLPRKHLCRFLAVPDVVGSAIRTMECFDFYAPKLADWPLAFVCQDGQERLPIPWSKIDAVFIGGSTDFKMGKFAAEIVKASIIMEKWCHVGRVNTPGRYEYFKDLGANSCDGTGLARYSHMREKLCRELTEPRFDFGA